VSGLVVSAGGRRIELAEEDLEFTWSRSSGPGGQNVNRVETRVTLRFDVARSRGLTEDERRRITERLATRVSNEGILRVTVQRHRTREANRRAAVERFAELVAFALHREAPRRPTKTSRAARQKRLEEKRRRGEAKRSRSGRGWEE
jgi:ribosome-associated protein